MSTNRPEHAPTAMMLRVLAHAGLGESLYTGASSPGDFGARVRTIDALIARGWLANSGGGRVHVTDAGRKALEMRRK
jgi:hypothetical protein